MKTIRSPNLAPGDEGIMVMVSMGRGFARGGLVRAAGKVRGAGRFGDTMLVHINEKEFHQLRRAWGEPHWNPDTELPEFWDIGSVLSGVGDALGGWGGVAKTVLPYIVGGLSNKSSIDQANRNLAPPDDPNMTTRMANLTVGRTAIPQPHQDLASYYKYGQGPETNFFKNNSLSGITGPPGAQITRPPQYSPSGLEAAGSGALSGIAQLLAKKYLSPSSTPSSGADPNAGWQGPTAESLGQSPTPFTMAGAVPAAAAASASGVGALPALPMDAARHGALALQDMTDAEALTPVETTASMAAMPTAAAGAPTAAGSGLLPGSIPGASMADTGAAINPGLMEATSPGAGSSLSVLGGLGIGAGSIAATAMFANYMDKHHSMTPQDYLKQYGGQSLSAMQEAAAAHAAGDTAKEKQYLALAETTKALSGMIQGNLNGQYTGDGLTTNRDPGATRYAKSFAVGGQVNSATANFGQQPGYMQPAQSGATGNLASAAPGMMNPMAASGNVGMYASNPFGPGAPGPGAPPPMSGPGAPGGYANNASGGLGTAFGPIPGAPGLGPTAPGGGNMIQNTGDANGNMINNGPGSSTGALSTANFNAQRPMMGSQFGALGNLANGVGIQRPPMPNPGMPPPAFGPGAPGPGAPPPMSGPGGPGPGAPPPMGINRPPMPNPGMPPPNPAQFGVRQPAGIAPRPMIPQAGTMGGYGGALSRFGAGSMGYGMRGRATGGPVDGPGTGTSDDIPARLSAGEYVVPAHVVAALGDGSTSAGAAKLDRLQQNVRKSVGRQMASGRHPRSAMDPVAYMGRGRK